jgi:hypothetical protein
MHNRYGTTDLNLKKDVMITDVLPTSKIAKKNALWTTETIN